MLAVRELLNSLQTDLEARRETVTVTVVVVPSPPSVSGTSALRSGQRSVLTPPSYQGSSLNLPPIQFQSYSTVTRTNHSQFVIAIVHFQLVKSHSDN